MPHWLFCLLLCLSSLSTLSAIQCYSGSQLQVIECPALSCIKQTLGFDTVRYCDGTGISSICSTYRIFETCETIPNLGFICCCSGNLCNSTSSWTPWSLLGIMVMSLWTWMA